MTTNRKALRNVVLYGLFALLAAWVFTLTASFPRPLLPGYPGSALFPRLTVLLMGFFSLLGILLEVIGLVRNRPTTVPAPAPDVSEMPGDGPRLTDVLAVFGLLAAFVAVSEYMGMEVGVFLFTALMIFLVTRRPFIAAVAGIASVAVVYFLFVQGLSVFMPLTFLPRYISW